MSVRHPGMPAAPRESIRRPPRFVRRRVRLAVVPVLAALAVAPPATTTAQQTGAIRGTITDAGTGQPVAGAVVEATGPVDAGPTQSSSEGRYLLTGLRPGSYTLTVRALGYARRTLEVRLGPGETAILDIALASEALELEEVVVSASRRQEKELDAPAHIVTVRAPELRARPALSPIDHMRDATGLDVASGGLIQSNVVARGFNNVFSGALLTLADNRITSVPSLRYNAFYLIPPTTPDLDRVELLLGPASALYGPNSANGVLHLLTTSPFDAPGTEASLAVGGRASSCPRRVDGSCTSERITELAAPEDGRSVVQGTFRTAGTLGERVGYRVSGQYMTGGDWQSFDAFEDSTRADILDDVPAPERDAMADTLSVARRDFAIERWSGDARIDVRPDGDAEIIVATGVSNVGNAVDLTPLGAAQIRDWRYTYAQLRAHRGRLFAQAYVNAADAGDSFLLRTGEAVVDRSRMVVGQLQHGTELGPATLTYGADILWTNPRTEGTIHGRNEDDDAIFEAGAYLHSELALTPSLDLVAALRADHHNRLPDPVVSPRAALLYRLSDRQTLRLTYNRAFSTPSANNLFLDIKAAELADGRLQIRALGVPDDGLFFRRDCDGGVLGLCMRSPFARDAGFIAASAGTFSATSAVWDSIVALVRDPLLAATGFDLAAAGIPAPGSDDVGTVLRTFDPGTLTFRSVQADALIPVAPLRPTITNTLEVGYKGIIRDRLLLEADVYYTRKTDFTGPLIVETPAVFFDPATLRSYIDGYVADPTLAFAVTAAIAGLPGSTLTGVPVGIVTWDHPLVTGPNMYLTFRNFGEVELWGADVTAKLLLGAGLAVAASYSRVSDNFFEKEEVGGLVDVPLNAPRDKASASLTYRDEARGLRGEVRVRHVGAFPMNSGAFIGDLDAYTVLDLNGSVGLPFVPAAELAVEVRNALNQLHRELVGAPELGLLALARLRYRF